MINVRWATDADADALVRLYVEGGWDPEHDVAVRHVVEDPRLVAEDASGDVVGFIDGRFEGSRFEGGRIYNERFGAFEDLPTPHCMLDKACVYPHARRAGVGRRLLHAFANEAQARGCSHVALMVDWGEGKEDRLAFFAAVGFYPLDKRRPDDLLGVYVDTLIVRTVQQS